MPIKECQKNGKPGYKYGDSGNCYTYEPGNKASREKAKDKAQEQASAIHASGYKG